MIWATLGNLIAGPLVNAYKAKLEAGNTTERLAADLALRELDVQAKEIEVQHQLRIAQVGYWYTPESLFGYIMVIYFAKVVLWDKVLGWGTTDAITGPVAEWAMLIMMFYFGKRGIENVARILKGSR